MTTTTAPSKEGFAGRVRRLRIEKCLSQEELAEKARLSRHTIWRMESGRFRKPYLSSIWRLAEALGVDPKELLGDDLALWTAWNRP